MITKSILHVFFYPGRNVPKWCRSSRRPTGLCSRVRLSWGLSSQAVEKESPINAHYVPHGTMAHSITGNTNDSIDEPWAEEGITSMRSHSKDLVRNRDSQPCMVCSPLPSSWRWSPPDDRRCQSHTTWTLQPDSLGCWTASHLGREVCVARGREGRGGRG